MLAGRSEVSILLDDTVEVEHVKKIGAAKVLKTKENE